MCEFPVREALPDVWRVSDFSVNSEAELRRENPDRRRRRKKKKKRRRRRRRKEEGQIYRKKARRTSNWTEEWMKEDLCCHYFTAPRKNVHRSSAQNPISLQLCCLRSRNTAFGILSTLGAGRSGIPFLIGKRGFTFLGKAQTCWCPLGNGSFFSGGKAAGKCDWLLISA